MILRKAVALSRGYEPDVTSGILANKLNNYSSLLAAQGSLDTALRYLGDSTEVTSMSCYKQMNVNPFNTE